jgi:hypothetical protein
VSDKIIQQFDISEILILPIISSRKPSAVRDLQIFFVTLSSEIFISGLLGLFPE